jgi:hypothetical protein
MFRRLAVVCAGLSLAGCATRYGDIVIGPSDQSKVQTFSTPGSVQVTRDKDKAYGVYKPQMIDDSYKPRNVTPFTVMSLKPERVP